MDCKVDVNQNYLSNSNESPLSIDKFIATDIQIESTTAQCQKGMLKKSASLYL